MSYNISDSFSKKYYNPSEKVREKNWDLDETKKALVTTTDTVVKEGNNGRVEKKSKTNLM